MIRAIVAIDSKRGISDTIGIPWDLPQERKYFRLTTENHEVLMGYNTYLARIGPLKKRRNFVICEPQSVLRDGFEPVYDIAGFLESKRKEDLWIIGGAETYRLTMPYCQELYITQINQDFRCTKFFPDIPDSFLLVKESETMSENNATYTYQIWEQRS